MKATEAKLLSFLQKSPQFVIPIYQRTYSWTDKQCRQLWDDILRAGSSDTIAVHFIGSIVYVEQGLSQVTHQAPLLVIDGQQRLTTVSLLIEALARALGDGEPVDGFSSAKLRHYYLSKPLESGDRYFKLLLSQTDNVSLKAVIKNTEQPNEPSLRVTQNFDLFTELLAEQKGDLAPVCRGLAKLVVVDIALSRDQDNPQLIFESMNSTGKELSQADLIRNFILMGLEPGRQTRLYEEYWRPMELDFGQEAYGTQFDSFMRHYLTVRTGDIRASRTPVVISRTAVWTAVRFASRMHPSSERRSRMSLAASSPPNPTSSRALRAPRSAASSSNCSKSASGMTIRPTSRTGRFMVGSSFDGLDGNRVQQLGQCFGGDPGGVPGGLQIVGDAGDAPAVRDQRSPPRQHERRFSLDVGTPG
ncbi:hypothetical protein BAL199_13905 [alpha proteobacterium BAL199]|nr:hypothetical protein BAL199_13905 [alpha proteobacterium BAL199]